MIRASMCRSLVMIPDWLPVKLIASPPSSRIAIESSAIEMRSPADSSMSSSRRSGAGEVGGGGGALGGGGELVGGAPHGGDHDDDISPFAFRANNALGALAQPPPARAARPAVLLNDNRHARTRYHDGRGCLGSTAEA